MRLRGSLFWGIVLIILAVFLLLNQQGWLKGDILGYFWPVVIILVGIWILVSALGRSRVSDSGQKLTIPLEGAQAARIKLEHGAGRLKLRSGASSTEILNGDFGTEVDYKSRLEAGQLEVKLRTSPHFWAWYPGENLDWDIRLNGDIPLKIKIDSGASASILDLSELKVIELDIDTGASSTEVILPANAGNTLVDIDSGAASLNMHVPVGVAARIRIKSGLASINIDSTRFPRLDDGIYQSTDYATAANRADIAIETGVGSVEIR